MDDDGLKRERERALEHPIRRALRDTLGGSEERSLNELAAVELPNDPTRSAVAYHLTILQRTKLVACVGGVYRLA
jgi:DNA-binding transcriptional ArsR family regulator